MKNPLINMISENTNKFIADLLDSVSSVSNSSGQERKINQIINLGTVIPIIKHHDVVNAKVINKVIIYP